MGLVVHLSNAKQLCCDHGVALYLPCPQCELAESKRGRLTLSLIALSLAILLGMVWWLR